MRREIVSMDEKQLEIAMQWAKKEGWNPGTFDFRGYYRAFGADAFKLLLLNGKPIGSISIVSYSDNFAFIGLFIVLPEYRHQGHGTYLWEHAMDAIKAYSTTGLYAVRQQIHYYEKYQFFSENEAISLNKRWQLSTRHRENVIHLVSDDTDACQQKSDYDQMIKWDSTLWGYSRKTFFDTMLTQPECYAYVSIDNETSEIAAYGMIRPTATGFRIGSLYSKNLEEAKNLTRILLAQTPENSKVVIDIPRINPFAEKFAAYFELENVNSADTLKMIQGEKHDGCEQECYAVASLEIG